MTEQEAYGTIYRKRPSADGTALTESAEQELSAEEIVVLAIQNFMKRGEEIA